jgi:gamma-butyrobetaine dioxygenase
MNIPATLEGVQASPDSLTLQWADGRSTEFAAIWLRDNQSEQRDAHSGQRLVDIADFPAAPTIRAASLHAGVVQVHWEHEPHTATFEVGWLAAQADTPIEQVPMQAWVGGALDALRDFAWVGLRQAKENTAERSRWLTRLLTNGIAFLSEVPATDEAILEAMSLVGRVAETNYGLVFDVRAVAQPENLAFSDLGLGLHTDNPYREPVPGFQALHMLIAAPGGENLFADGLALAAHLRHHDPDAFARLTSTAVPFRYRSKDADLYAERPLIQLSCEGAVTGVHYNNRSIAPLRLSLEFQLKFRLRSGDLVLYDNQRILHGRTPFSSAKHARHLRGCYLTRDSVYSESALLRRHLSAVPSA